MNQQHPRRILIKLSFEDSPGSSEAFEWCQLMRCADECGTASRDIGKKKHQQSAINGLQAGIEDHCVAIIVTVFASGVFKNSIKHYLKPWYGPQTGIFK